MVPPVPTVPSDLLDPWVRLDPKAHSDHSARSLLWGQSRQRVRTVPSGQLGQTDH